MIYHYSNNIQIHLLHQEENINSQILKGCWLTLKIMHMSSQISTYTKILCRLIVLEVNDRLLIELKFIPKVTSS